MKSIGLLLCLFLSISLLSAQKLSKKDHVAIMKVFSEQEAAWNRGDIEAFMEGYWKSDSLSFISSRGVNKGWDATRQGYYTRYPDRATMGHLTFDIVKLEKMGPKSAFVIGKWHLKREMGDIGGYFTLVWRKIDGKWVITSDHTS